MRQAWLFPLILLSSWLLVECHRLTPLTPANPIIGNWRFSHVQMYHEPAYFVAIAHVPYQVISTDTVFQDVSLAFNENVQSYTFTSTGSFSELYVLHGNIADQRVVSVDTGQWSLADSTVSLRVTNTYPHKLTYLPTTDELVTDLFAQTTILRSQTLPAEWYTLSYTIRIYYQRSS